ncbi:MAG: hypothetical protein ACF8R7_04070 [Phycisphaerales bacterium JB039]
MRWRLLRRCLLCAILGLITSVAVAWGLSVPWDLTRLFKEPHAQGYAVVDEVIVDLSVRRGVGWRTELWRLIDTKAPGPQHDEVREIARSLEERIIPLRQAATITEPPWSLDERAAEDPPIVNMGGDDVSVLYNSFGWPLTSVGSTRRLDYTRREGVIPPVESHAAVLTLPWRRPHALTGMPDNVRLPLRPLPGLLLNTIFYGLLWALLLFAPGAIRRRIRRAKGRCPKCGFSLAGQPQPGCPECGHGRAPAARAAA